MEKVMVMLSARQVHALDKICLEIRQTTGIKFKRSMLIRSIIDGFLEAAPSYDCCPKSCRREAHHFSNSVSTVIFQVRAGCESVASCRPKWRDPPDRSLEARAATDFSVASLLWLMLYNQAPQTGRGAGVAERGCLLSSCTG